MEATVLTPELEELLRLKNDCWYFSQKCVWTRDEADKWMPIKKYPDKEYLHTIMNLMVREQILAIVKHGGGRVVVPTLAIRGLGERDSLCIEETDEGIVLRYALDGELLEAKPEAG